MTEKKEIYKCNVCGNIVEVLHEGAGELVCCNQPMIHIKELSEESPIKDNPTSPESKTEKHKPVIEDKVVKIGSVEHPMTEEHYIEWIEATSKSGQVCKKFLIPNEKPEAEFEFEIASSRAYCNLHGLWTSD